MPANLKDQSTRARRNKATTRSVLSADHDIETPPLPEGIPWHGLTEQWWAGLWESEMAPEYLAMDIHGLYRVAMLMNDFWLAGTAKERSEVQVRLEKADAEYGTNPLARRRLEWQIETTEDSKRKGRARRGDEPPAAPPAPEADPRLRLVT